MDRVAELLDAGTWQSGYCVELGAPTWAAVIDAVVDKLGSEELAASSRLLVGDEGSVLGTMVWLRYLGAIHRLVLDDPSCGPARYFRTTGGDAEPDAAVPVVLRFVAEHEVEIRRSVVTPPKRMNLSRRRLPVNSMPS